MNKIINPAPIRVLLVEDVEDDMFIIEDHLHNAEHQNFDLTWVDDRDKAISKIISNDYDIVLLDHDLVCFTGMEILREVRENHHYLKAIIFLSGSKNPLIRIEALKYGASGFLVKGDDISPSLMELSILFAIEKANNIIHLEELVQQRTVELEQAHKSLVEKETLAKLGEMVSGMAHEINTPLGGGVTVASHLQAKTNTIVGKFESDQITKEDLQKYLTLAQKSCDNLMKNLGRAAELILSFKRMSVDQSGQQLRQFNLKECINDVITSLHHKLKYTKIRTQVECSDYIILQSYPGIYSQIITNLLNNSLIHAYDDKQEGCISISVSQSNDKIYLEYRDDGAGMSEEILNKLFVPFFTTKRNEGGSGLGTSIIYNCVQQLKGTLKASSEPGKGTCFTFELPATPPASAADITDNALAKTG